MTLKEKVKEYRKLGPFKSQLILKSQGTLPLKSFTETISEIQRIQALRISILEEILKEIETNED